MPAAFGFRSVPCPWCKQPIAWRHVDARFVCPWCHHGVLLRNRYFRAVYVLAIAVAALVSHALGFRGQALLAMTVFATLPTYWVMLSVTLLLFPPETDQTGDYQAILYGPPPVEADDVAAVTELETGSSTDGALDDADGPRRPLVGVKPEPASLEGWAIRLGVLTLVGCLLWMAAEPALYRLFPRFMGTRTGPAEFPIVVVIEEDGLSLTNGSTERWTCSVSTSSTSAREPVISRPVEVAGNRTQRVLYAEFRASSDSSVDTLVASLREELTVSCTEAAGRLLVKEFSSAGLPVRIREP